MATSASFKTSISEFIKKAGARGDLVVRKIALDVTKRVVEKSPVDTGRFRGSWMASVGSADTSQPGTLDKGGGVSVARMAALAPGVKVGDTIYLSSNLPYSVKLEYGHSKQAPAGVVRVTIAEFGGILTAAVAEAKSEVK